MLLGLQRNYDFLDPNSSFLGTDTVGGIVAGNVIALCMVIELMLTPARSLRRTLRIIAVIDNFPSFSQSL